jgi:hypothetical protein
MLLNWWHRHLCDPSAETAARRLETERAPESVPNYWDTLCSLIAQGKPDAARALLASHTQLRAAAEGASLASPGAALLLRLDLLLDTIPRMSEPDVLAPQHEAAPPSLGDLELFTPKTRWRQLPAKLPAKPSLAPASRHAYASASCFPPRIRWH